MHIVYIQWNLTRETFGTSKLSKIVIYKNIEYSTTSKPSNLSL